MHTAIFKLFPSVVNPKGWSTIQSFSTQIKTPYTLDTYQIHTKFVPLYALYLSQISKQSGCALKITAIFFCKCEKRINQAPLTSGKRKK